MPFSQIGLQPPMPHGTSLRTRLVQIAVCLAMGGPLVYDNLRSRFDPLILYSYQGTDGPLDMVTTAAGVPRPGQPMSSIAPGGTVYWISTLCVQEGATSTAFVSLVHEEDSRTIYQRDRVFPPSEKRCGPLPGSLTIPADAPPGQYRIDRRLQLLAASGAPRMEQLPPIRFEVKP